MDQHTPSRRRFLQTAGLATGAILTGTASAQTQPASQPTALPVRDRVDVFRFDQTHQVIENFSASDCWSCESAGQWPDEDRNKLADLLFSVEKGAGLSCWRINLGAGFDNTIRQRDRTIDCYETAPGQYDFSKCPGQRWLARAAMDRGVKQLLAFVNSPPLRLTRNGRPYSDKADDGLYSTNLKAGVEPDFARYLCDIVEYFQSKAPENERIPFTYLSPINEPDVAWDGPGQEGCRYGVEDMRRVYRAVADEINRRKLPIEIIGPETNQAHHMVEQREYARALGEHPATRDLFHKRLCFHDYDVLNVDARAYERRQRIGQRLAKMPGWKFWMSEFCFLEWRKDLTMDAGLRLAKLMHTDLTVADVSAWQWWLGLSFGDYKDGLIHSDKRTRELSPAKMLWVMGQYSRFVRPGAKRITFTGTNTLDSTVLASAFRHDEDKQLAIVYINTSSEAATVRPNLEGRDSTPKFSDWSIYRTSETEDIKAISSIKMGDLIELPPRSVTTLVSKWT